MVERPQRDSLLRLTIAGRGDASRGFIKQVYAPGAARTTLDLFLIRRAFDERNFFIRTANDD